MLRTFVAILALTATVVPVRAADLELDKLLAKETDLVLSLNVRQVLDSPIVKKHATDLLKTALASSKETQEAIKALGLDPLTDFNRVSIGVGIEDLNQPKMLVAVEGKFDLTKIGATLDTLAKDQPQRFRAEKTGGRTVWNVTAPNQAIPLYAAIVDSGLIVFANGKENAAAGFQAAQGTRKPEISKELAALLAKADRNSSLFLVAYTKGKLNSIPQVDAEMKKIIDQVHSITADLKVTDVVRLDLAVGTPGADEAKKMREMIAAGIDLAKIQVKVALAQQPELQPLIELVNSMTATQKDREVIVSAKIDGSSLEKIFEKK